MIFASLTLNKKIKENNMYALFCGCSRAFFSSLLLIFHNPESKYKVHFTWKFILFTEFFKVCLHNEMYCDIPPYCFSFLYFLFMS